MNTTDPLLPIPSPFPAQSNVIFFPFGASAMFCSASAALRLASHDGCMPGSTRLALRSRTGWAFALTPPRVLAVAGSNGATTVATGAGGAASRRAFFVVGLDALPPFVGAGAPPTSLTMWFAPLPYFCSQIL